LFVVQVIVALDAVIPVGTIPEIVSGTVRASVAELEPFSVPVTVTFWSELKAFAVATNVPLTEPGGIETEGGTVTLLEFVLKPTVPPPDALRVTVQVAEESGDIVPGLQVIPEMVSAATSASVVAVEEPFSVPVTVTV